MIGWLRGLTLHCHLCLQAHITSYRIHGGFLLTTVSIRNPRLSRSAEVHAAELGRGKFCCAYLLLD